MKKLMIAGLVLSMAGASALPAAAQDYRGRDRDSRVEQRQDRREFQQERRQDRREFRQEQRQDRRAFQQAQRRYNAGRYYAPRGYQARNWGVGQRLPRSYYAQPYAIRDYRTYGLYAPPAGYQWTRVGNDAVLTAVVSGVIGAVVGGLFF
jgi:Ni/Co efflux regulator RcnB